MEIFTLSIGPIVGYTTATTCRIFGGGEGNTEDKFLRRCHGVARVKQKKEKNYQPTQIFQMNPIFDFTGVTEFYELQPNQTYDFQMGYIIDEREPKNILQEEDFEKAINWSKASTGTFKTTSDNVEQPINFVFGSCRYMLKLGKFFFDTRGDKIFRSILALNEEQGLAIGHCLMLGDQIYADDLNFLGADTTVPQYYERYRVAFSQPHIAKLMSNLSTYMILDDHEIEDNWPEKANDKDNQNKYPAALHAYQIYQVSHSPIMEMKEGKFIESPNRFWYNFSSGCGDFFITDTRTERYLTLQESERLIISTRQMTALKKWLNDKSGKIKFIGSSVPFFPDVKSGWEDKWAGFLVQRTELLNFIKENEIKKVVFLSGDVHSSLSAQLESNDKACKITSIISSSFFWPVAIYRSKDFQLSGTLKVLGANKYEIINPSAVTSDDNFTLVSATPKSLTITVYDRKGEILIQPYKIDLN